MNIPNEVAAAVAAKPAKSATLKASQHKALKAGKGKGKAAPAKNDSPELTKATQRALNVWGRADGAAESSMLDVFAAVARGGLTTPDMIRKAAPHIGDASCKVYSATFNKAAKVARILGTPATLDLIESAKDFPGRKWERVRDMLAHVMETDKGSGGGGKPAPAKAAELMVKAAKSAQVDKDAAKAKAKSDAKTAASRAPQTPSIPAAPAIVQVADIPAKAKELRAALTVQLGDLVKWPVSAAMKGAHKAAVNSLQDALESLSVLAK